jgi:hypothetical protein
MRVDAHHSNYNSMWTTYFWTPIRLGAIAGLEAATTSVKPHQQTRASNMAEKEAASKPLAGLSKEKALQFKQKVERRGVVRLSAPGGRSMRRCSTF